MVFEYSVGGTRHVGDYLRLQEAPAYRHKAQDAIARHPAGGNVTVYHDPADPRQAVLEKGTSRAAFLTLFVPGSCWRSRAWRSCRSSRLRSEPAAHGYEEVIPMT